MDHRTAHSACSATVPAYLCHRTTTILHGCITVPARRGQRAVKIGWARGNYAGTAGFTDNDHTSDGGGAPTANPFDGNAGDGIVPGVAGNPALSKGPIFFQSTTGNNGTRFTDITDGTSNTIMINEVRSGYNQLDPRGVWALGYPGMSITNAGRNYNPTPNNTLDSPDGQTWGDEMQNCYKFWYSRHRCRGLMAASRTLRETGPARSATHAASIRAASTPASPTTAACGFVSNNIDQYTWCILQSKNDGQVILNEP